MNCYQQIQARAFQPIARMPRMLTRHLIFAATVAAGAILAGCSGGTTSTIQASPTPSAAQASAKPSASGTLPSYSRASRLRPCDSVSPTELKSVIGKPVQVDEVGDIGQKPVLSSGPVLRKVWIATCNWKIPAYPTTSLYLQVELTPSPAGARTDFDGMRSGMTIREHPIHEDGYGQAVVFNTDNHGGVVILVLQGAEIINFQFNSTSRPAPSAEARMRMARTITRLIMRQYRGS
jgi:hypothetical protein